MEITSTGDNLTVSIHCFNNHVDSWMAYASWYSMKKFLPDATVIIDLHKTEEVQDYFLWARRRHLLWDRSTRSWPCLGIRPMRMAVRKLDKENLDMLNNVDSFQISLYEWYHRTDDPNEESRIHDCNYDSLCADVTSDKVAPFVSYSDFGNFTLSEWIDKKECPFFKIDRLKGNSINEKKVLELWKKAACTFNK